MIHLFGIRYADEIWNCGAPVTEIVRLSGLRTGYNAKVSKGVGPARYVVPRGGWLQGAAPFVSPRSLAASPWQ